MKKLVSFLTLALIVFLCASMIIPVSAADEKVNLLAGAELAEIHGIKDHADYKPEHLFDNSTIYTGQKDSYCDFSLACSKEPVVNGTAPRYNLFGETDKEDSLYLMSFQVRLATPAEAGSFQFFGLDNTNLDLDGFDVWVSETGETGSYVKIFSGTHLWCDGKYDTIVTDNLTTTTITCTFDTMKVGYLAFGVTEPRCQHAEKGNVSPYPHYMRITELALYAPEAAATTALVITAAPTTTVTPTTTAAPTTSAPVTTPKTADNALFIGLIALAGISVVAITFRRTKTGR